MDNKKAPDDDQQLAVKANCCTITNPDLINNTKTSNKVPLPPASKTVHTKKCDTSSNKATTPRLKKVTKTYLKASTFKYKYKTFRSHVDDGLASRMGSMSLNHDEMIRLCGETVALSCDLVKLPASTSNDSADNKLSKDVSASIDSKKQPLLTSPSQTSPSKTKNRRRRSSGRLKNNQKAADENEEILSVKITSPAKDDPSCMTSSMTSQHKMTSCSTQARSEWDMMTDDLATYMADCWQLPKEMSTMAEMMYT